MFTEEVGVSPLAGDGGLLYQARVAELVGSGRSFARIEDGKVVFKAEIGAATNQACQIQGVWVAPNTAARAFRPPAWRPSCATRSRTWPPREPVCERLQRPGPGLLPTGRFP